MRKLLAIVAIVLAIPCSFAQQRVTILDDKTGRTAPVDLEVPSIILQWYEVAK